MKCPWILLILVALVGFRPDVRAEQKKLLADETAFKVLQDRFEALPLPMEVRFGNHIAKPVEQLLGAGRRECEKMLGRAALYFPIFERQLKTRQLPEILKYLPVVESRLLPKATSSAGAEGLWQFMPETAKMYRLRMSEYIDERQSPYASTEAAVNLLADLYDEFGDWLLALAAYNCGPRRVQRAMRLEKCTNFWDIKHRLPRQTQKYIPRFLAAVYVFEQPELHGLKTRFLPSNLQQNQMITVYHYLRFSTIAQTCGVSESTIRYLNPAFRQDVVPSSRRGYVLILPEKIMPTFYENFADKLGERVDNGRKTNMVSAKLPSLKPTAVKMTTDHKRIEELCFGALKRSSLIL